MLILYTKMFLDVHFGQKSHSALILLKILKLNPRYTSIELDPESEMPKQFLKSNGSASSFGYRGDPMEMAKHAASQYEYLSNYLTMVGTKSFRNFQYFFGNIYLWQYSISDC